MSRRRRDDGLRGRAGDEVPNMIAQVLRDRGVTEGAIQIIPDEQAAIDAARKAASEHEDHALNRTRTPVKGEGDDLW